MAKKFTNTRKTPHLVAKIATRMQKFRYFWGKIPWRSPWLPLLFIVPSAIFLLPIDLFTHPFFLALSLFLALPGLLLLALRLPRLRRTWRTLTHLRPRDLLCPERRARLALAGGLLLNLSYAIFRTVMGVTTRSLWFCSEGVYYAALGAVRFFPAEAQGRSSHDAAHVYRLGARLLLLLFPAVAATVALALTHTPTVNYSTPTVVLTVLFTLWRVGAAAYSLWQFHRRRNALHTLSKAISLSAAAVSLFGLQCTLLIHYGTRVPLRRIFNAASGSFVCFSLPVTALFILRTGKQAPKSR